MLRGVDSHPAEGICGVEAYDRGASLVIVHSRKALKTLCARKLARVISWAGSYHSNNRDDSLFPSLVGSQVIDGLHGVPAPAVSQIPSVKGTLLLATSICFAPKAAPIVFLAAPSNFPCSSLSTSELLPTELIPSRTTLRSIEFAAACWNMKLTPCPSRGWGPGKPNPGAGGELAGEMQ